MMVGRWHWLCVAVQSSQKMASISLQVAANMRTFLKVRMLTMAAFMFVSWMVVTKGVPSLFRAFAASPTDEEWTTISKTALFGSTSLVHTFSSAQDEILYIYQKYMLADWRPRPDRVARRRDEIFASSNSTTPDQFVLTQQNTNSSVPLPLYSPKLSGKKAFVKPQPDMLKYLRKDSVYLNGTVFNKCSVVGNGGMLTNSNCGREIDSADFVLRCNLVPIQKYGVDAGYKTNFTTMNPSIVFTRYNGFKTNEDVFAFIRHLNEYNGHLFLPCFFDQKILDICTSQILPTIQDSPHRERLAVTVGNPRHLRGIMKPWMSAGIHLMSTGFYLAQSAITMCNEIHLYGFWPFSKTVYPVPKALKYHFFDDRGQTHSHKLSAEFQILWQLHMEGIVRLHTHDCDDVV